MIVHHIAPYTRPHHTKTPRHTAAYSSLPKGKNAKFKGEFGSEDHKKFIFIRALIGCKFKEGEKVRYKGQIGDILEVYTDFTDERIVWDKLYCRFVEVIITAMDGKDYHSEVVHPNELRKVR